MLQHSGQNPQITAGSNQSLTNSSCSAGGVLVLFILHTPCTTKHHQLQQTALLLSNEILNSHQQTRFMCFELQSALWKGRMEKNMQRAGEEVNKSNTHLLFLRGSGKSCWQQQKGGEKEIFETTHLVEVFFILPGWIQFGLFI